MHARTALRGVTGNVRHCWICVRQNIHTCRVQHEGVYTMSEGSRSWHIALNAGRLQISHLGAFFQSLHGNRRAQKGPDSIAGHPIRTFEKVFSRPDSGPGRLCIFVLSSRRTGERSNGMVFTNVCA